MKPELKAYLDGAAMAYRDTADHLESMINRAPAETKQWLMHLRPIAIAARQKAENIYEEADKFLHAVRQ